MLFDKQLLTPEMKNTILLTTYKLAFLITNVWTDNLKKEIRVKPQLVNQSSHFCWAPEEGPHRGAESGNLKVSMKHSKTHRENILGEKQRSCLSQCRIRKVKCKPCNWWNSCQDLSGPDYRSTPGDRHGNAGPKQGIVPLWGISQRRALPPGSAIAP